MALRLQMKLGVVRDDDRLPDSPDTVVVVEPTVGARARTKGQLYLLVTSAISGPRAAEATRLAAETIQNEYYYDESAGIRVCLEKAIAAANKRLTHIRDRYGLGDAQGSGPIGIGVAVVRSNELYVATVGPAEAYLIRSARLSTLPDPNRERGLPTREPAPEVWRGELSVGDSLVLVSPNLMARLGPDELKDAMITLHPQSAMEHLHHRFLLADGAGSDGALAIEATEVSTTQQGRNLVGVRSPEPLAGLPNRSPIPLADSVTGGVAAVQAGAQKAQAAAGGAAGRLFRRIQDLLPRREQPYRRVTPLSTRRAAQRRAAAAILVFVAVVGSIGMGIWLFGGGSRGSAQVISSVNAGQAALDKARGDLDKVYGSGTNSGINLVANDPTKALQLLTDAYAQLAAAEKAGVPATVATPLRTRVVAGLDSLYGMADVKDGVLFTMPDNDPPIDLRGLVKGPDGAPYVLDAGTKTVYRIDLKAKSATAVLRAGQKVAGGADAAEPKLMSVGGPDLLVLDAGNVLWRWRPADAKGKGTLARVKVSGSSGWGQDVSGIGTYVRNANAGLYNLYVIDPSEQQILAYAPAADGSGFPAAPSGRLATARPVDGMKSLLIDGDIFAVENGGIERFVSGKTDGWDVGLPGDELLRKAPSYQMIASGSDRRVGRLYGWDPANLRIVAFDKVDGRFRGQFRLSGGGTAWSDIRGMYIIPGVSDQPDSVVWISGNALHEVVLEAVVVAPSPPPSVSGAPAGSSGPAGSGTPSTAPAP